MAKKQKVLPLKMAEVVIQSLGDLFLFSNRNCLYLKSIALPALWDSVVARDVEKPEGMTLKLFSISK